SREENALEENESITGKNEHGKNGSTNRSLSGKGEDNQDCLMNIDVKNANLKKSPIADRVYTL
ncbi:37050_t:CDS:1, partial [Gigaspora margarita]